VDASEKSWQSGCAVVSEILIGNADPTSEQANEAKKKAEDVRRAALSGRNFDQLARENSDSGSAQLGGRIGCLGQSYGAGASVLLEAADELSRPGSISPVIESIRGFHVLKLVGKVDEKNKSKLISEYQAYKLASADFAKDRALSFGQRLIKSAESGTTLEQALADQLGELFTEEKHPAKDAEGAPRVEISRAITIDQNPFDGATGDVPPGVALFSLEEEDDLIAEPIGTESGFVVMQLKSKELLTKEKFQEDEQSIIATLQARKAEQALSQYVSQLIKNAGGVRINEKYVPPADEDNEKAAEQDG
jgi:hypothetical protein